jgi:peptide/nickel transport system substrate-binding protein
VIAGSQWVRRPRTWAARYDGPVTRRRVAGWFLAGLGLLAACAPEPPPAPPARREVVVAVPVGPVHLDPQGPLDEYTASILHNSYEWLATFDPDMRPVPVLAERWSTLDERTWLFELRRGVRFHDGRPFDARVAAAIFERERLRRPDVAGVISGAEARSEHELLVRTRQPQVSVVEVAHVPMSLEAVAGGRPVGTGPFVIRSGEPGRDVELEAFGGYRDGPPGIDRLVFRVVREEEERVADLAAGRVHLALNLSAVGARAVSGLSGARLVTRSGLRVIALGLLTRPTPEVATPFHDSRARLAVALALDRPRLVRDALGGYGEVVDQMVTPEVFGHVDGLEPIVHDLARSRALLAEAGHAGGLALTLTFPRGRYQSIDLVAAEVARQLAAVGVRVAVEAEPAETVASHEARSPAFLMGWITSHSAARGFAELFHTPGDVRGSNNRTRFSDPALDEAVVGALHSSIDGQRKHIVAAGRRLRALMPLVPLYRQVDVYGVAGGLRFTPRAQRMVLGKDLRWE